MQSTNIRQIKAAIWDQAFIGRARWWCPMGGGRHQEEEGAAPGNDPWVGSLVSC
jgi:hypothetical protein